MLQIKTCDNKICNKMSNSNYTNYVMSFNKVIKCLIQIIRIMLCHLTTCQLSGADNKMLDFIKQYTNKGM